MTEAQAFAPGKLILMGEHAVVYGHEAIALALSRGTTVTLRRRPGPTRPEQSAIVDDRLQAALLTVLPAEGLGVDIVSDLPVGRGMGSSAALAVALVRAAAALEGQVASVETCYSRGMAIERVFHGNPSGVDHAVSSRGGALRYRRSPAGPVLEALDLPSLSLVVLDSGEAGDTGQMVAGVAARRPGIDGAIERIGELVRAALRHLHSGFDPFVFGALLTENHRLLRQIGVSTPTLDGLVQLALDAGALGAKLAGAGGGGVVLALVDEPSRLLSRAKAEGVVAFPVRPWPQP